MMRRAGEGVVLEVHLVDYTGARTPEADAELGRSGLEKVVDLVVFGDGLSKVGLPLDAGLNEVVAVHGGGHRRAFAAGLHELEHNRLPQHVLEHDTVRAQVEVTAAGHQLLSGGVVEMREQHLVGEPERPAYPSAHHIEVALHLLVGVRYEFRSRVYAGHWGVS